MSPMVSPMPGDQEAALRALAVAWGRDRFPGCRVLHELALGDRRVDLLFVREHDLVGVELKGPADDLAAGGRLAAQWREYRYWLPETWLVIDGRWRDHPTLRRLGTHNRLVAVGGALVQEHPVDLHRPVRDELCCSRVLELLHTAEAARIAHRTEVIPGPVVTGRRHKVLALLARLLTGHEIMRQVCTELRARTLTSGAADPPSRPPELCGDCPPQGYPTDKTRCARCPRRRLTGAGAGGKQVHSSLDQVGRPASPPGGAGGARRA